MPLPVHQNPVDESDNLIPDRTASAPYNFVPLPEHMVKVVGDAGQLPNHDTYANDGYPRTGYFVVKLTTKSPLYVRCGLSTRRPDPDTLSEFEKAEAEKLGDVPARFRDAMKNKPDFFYTRDPRQPVIPGSSLRGMLRNLLEIASYGKITKVTNKNLIYRAVGDATALGSWYREQTLGSNKTSLPHMNFDYPSPLLKGGYLCHYNGEWAIRPAKQHGGETFIHVEYSAAQPIIGGRGRWRVHGVFVQPTPRTPSNRGPGNLTLNLAVTNKVAACTGGSVTAPAGMVPAVLVESGHMSGAHAKHMHCAVYEENTAATPIPIPREMWEAYEEDRDMTRGIQTQTRKLTADGQPLFYLLDASGRLLFFGSTMMFRFPYRRSIHELIPESLRTPLLVDYSEALFGFVREKKDFPSGSPVPFQGSKERAYASRVFMSDATLVNNVAPQDLWLTGNTARVVTPKILSSPKPTSFQHYLVQPQTERGDLSHYDSPKRDAQGNLRGHETVIRGHKLYWHQGERTTDQIKETDPDWLDNNREVKSDSTQHTQFRPVKSGVTFSFHVYFENLSDQELGALCWVLHPLGDEQKQYHHNLGMGKPLGMGAVKLDATLHLIDRVTRYGSLFDGDKWQTGAQAEQQLSDRATLQQCAQAFEQDILRKLNPHPPCIHLSGLKRIGMLLKMLEWPGFPPKLDLDANNRVLTNPTRPNTRYMVVQLPNVPNNQRNEYRDRPVLPDPSAFGPLTGDAVPGDPAQAEDPVRVTARIGALRGKGEVSSVPLIVPQISRIADPKARQQCAELLKKWLQSQELWKKEPHASAPWRKQLDQLLGQ